MRLEGFKGQPHRRIRRSLQEQVRFRFRFAKSLLKQQFLATRPNQVCRRTFHTVCSEFSISKDCLNEPQVYKRVRG